MSDNETAITTDTPLLSKALAAQSEHNKDKTILADKLRDAAFRLQSLEHGHHAAAPVYCGGTTCPMAKGCPLLKAGFDYMIGKACPIEEDLLTRWTENYVTNLQIDRGNIIEYNLAADLAKIDLYNLRTTNRLAYEDFITQQAVGVDDDGTVHYRTELSVAAQWEEMLYRRKLKLLDALLATRKAVADAGAGSGQDPSTSISRVRAILEKAKKNLRDQAEAVAAEAAKPVQQ